MATNPPPQESGIGGFLRTQIGPFPIWVWLIGVGAVAGFIIIPKIIAGRSGQNTSAADAASSDAGSSNAGISPAQSWFNTTSQAGIDPYTGVPYSIEESINPATGNPNYYNPPVTNQTQAPGSPPPPPPVQDNDVTPPRPTGGSITYPHGMTVPFGGSQYTTPGHLELSRIAQQEYGFMPGSAQYNNAISALLTANRTQSGRGSWSAEHTPSAGDVITIPQVNAQTGQLVA